MSNLSTPSSGHVYFSLKDTQAQIRCALFVMQRRKVAFKLENGQQVVVKGQVSLYEARGDYQLIIDHVEPAGEGDLRRAFELLKLQLSQQGLFDAIRKRSLPVLPHSIGVITSPTGAAIRDILTVLKRRFPAIPIIIYPVAVQGIRAKYEIVAALATANKQQLCDVLILARGGGSLEDLYVFNEESVVRAMFASQIPIISGIGHETDITLADFVADLRAPTPSAAAEHATPDQQEWAARFTAIESRLKQLLVRKLAYQRQLLNGLVKHLQSQHPRQKLLANNQWVDDLEGRLNWAMQTKLQVYRHNSETKTAKLWQYAPTIVINSHKQRQVYLHNRLIQAMQKHLDRRKQQLLNVSQTLHTVSPLATLNRGYAIASLIPSGKLIRTIEQIKIGDMIQIRVARGHFTSQIKDINDD
ncbi:exodeoxyribonuclease VII large subunit [Crenothrix sp.]|uniref:exodeoxyribonuclease VII large subunit n=1 Tax=Crenothrix sp. TaxID=3100433 RepID=UPI00374DE552